MYFIYIGLKAELLALNLKHYVMLLNEKVCQPDWSQLNCFTKINGVEVPK